MAMTASSRAPESAGTQESERSPFARLTELLAPYQPGKPLIALSLGEPQHPVPEFVGPVLAKHIADFGRYPIAKGIEPFRRAAANWLSSRYRLPRPVDPETELLVLNGSREGLFFAGLTAARFVGERKGRPAILIPNPFYPAYAAGARAAGCEAIFLPTTLANGFLPDLEALDDATLARTVAIYIASGQSAGRGGNPGIFRPPEATRRPLRLHDPERRMLFGNLHQAGAGQHAGIRRA
jgi:aspartate/methionine/tyrosine aminotransferase